MEKFWELAFGPNPPVKMHRMSLKRGPFEKGPSFLRGELLVFGGAMCNIHIFRWFFVIPSTSTAQIGILEGWPCFATEKYHLPNLHFFRFHMLVFGGVSTLPRVPNSSPLNTNDGSHKKNSDLVSAQPSFLRGQRWFPRQVFARDLYLARCLGNGVDSRCLSKNTCPAGKKL